MNNLNKLNRDFNSIDWDLADVLLKKSLRNQKKTSEPITDKQRRYIKDLEKRHKVKFYGKTRAQASHFIGQYSNR